jgi:exopolysaccharide biosynthesis polyprenyl glycosylphosphotransferase
VIRRKYRFLTQVTLVCDLLVVAVAYFAAYEVLAAWRRHQPNTLPPFRSYLWVLAMIGPFWMVALWKSGLYEPRTYRSGWAMLRTLLKAQLIGGGMLLSAMFLSKSEEISRLLLQIYMILSGVALAAERFALRFLLDYRAQRLRGRKAWRVLLVGDALSVARYQDLLREHPYWGIEVIGTIDPPHLSSNGAGRNGSSNHGSWVNVLGQFLADEVLVICPWHEAADLASFGEACAERGLTFRILIDMPPPLTGRYYVEDMGGGCYVISLEVVPLDFSALLIKRAIDIAGAGLGLLGCAIVYPFYALWLRRVAPGPVLFTQDRVGRNGRIFTIYKFRTMQPDSEHCLKDLLSYNEMAGALFKMKSDPRIIPGGRFMRATHLDELPQFFNVLRGDMSLVGTRPPTPTEAARYENHHYRRLSMRPGITGPWQVKGNGSVSNFEEVVKLDCDYIDHWSLWLDAKLLLKTCAEVLKADGW